MSSETFINDLTEGSVWGKLIRYAIPFILANTLQTVYSMVDSIIVGQFVGADALAAVTSSGLLTDLYMMFGMGFSMAGQVLISQYVGRKELHKVNQVIGNVFGLLFIFGVIMTVICVTLVNWQLTAINLPEESFAYGQDYLRICGCGILFIYGYNAVSNILRGLGDSKHPLIFIAIASVTNLVLDLLFVVVFHMGTFGAGLATIMGQAISFIIAMIYLYHHKEAMHFDFKLSSFLLKKDTALMIIRLGFPSALQTTAISISVLFINACVNSYGVAASAAAGIGSKLEGLIRIVAASMGAAGTSMIAQCVGAKKYDRVKQVVLCNFTVVESSAAILSLIIFFFTRQVLCLFTTDVSVQGLIPIFRIFMVLAFLSYGLRNPFTAVVNGIGFASFGLFAGLMDGVVCRIGFAILFGTVLGFGISGFWYGSAAAGYVSALICMIYYFSGKWKTRKLITDQH